MSVSPALGRLKERARIQNWYVVSNLERKASGAAPWPESIEAWWEVLVKQNGQIGLLRLDFSLVNPAWHRWIPAQVSRVDVQNACMEKLNMIMELYLLAHCEAVLEKLLWIISGLINSTFMHFHYNYTEISISDHTKQHLTAEYYQKINK